MRHRIMLWLLVLMAGGVRVNAQRDHTPVILGGVTFQHRYAPVNGLRLHYVTGGQGEPLILLHGYPQTWYGWHKVMPLLARSYTLIVPDMRGLGVSERPKDGDYTKKTVADDVYKLALSLGYKTMLVAGQDMGGPVAFSLAAQHPEAVRALVCIENGPVPGYGLEDLMNPAKGGSWHFGFFAAPKFPEMLTRGREKEFLTAFAFRGEFVHVKDAITDADIAEYERSYSTPVGMAAGFGYYRAFAQDAKDNPLLLAALPDQKLPMPVLAVGGDHSFGDATQKGLSRVAINVQGVLMQDCGHFVYDERPDKLTEAIQTFFAALPSLH